MARRLFDRTFGKGFLDGIPDSPGVYLVRNQDGALIYVGKAKHLRRRLSQYRNARRLKKHRRMTRIIRDAAVIEWRECRDEKEALLAENELIRAHRPRHNVSGAFSFIYPSIGIRRFADEGLHVCYTTMPERLAALGMDMFGSFRSRELTRGAFDALLTVLAFAGHRETVSRLGYPRVPYSAVAGFRMIPRQCPGLLADFLDGASDGFLRWAFEHLLEKPAARRRGAEVEEALKSLAVFFAAEARRLRDARGAAGQAGGFVPQGNRDRLFILAKFAG